MLRGGSTLFSLILTATLVSPALAEQETVLLVEEAMPGYLENLLSSVTSVQMVSGAGSEEAVARGEAFGTVVPVERLADRVRAIDLFSVPFLFESNTNRDRILDRTSPLRAAFDTSVMAFGLRIVALIPIGYEGIAFKGEAQTGPSGLTGMRILADGAAERGLAGSLEATPIIRGNHDAAFFAAWETTDTYSSYLDLRQAVSLMAVMVDERAWQSLSESDRQDWLGDLAEIEAAALVELDARHGRELARLRTKGIDVVSISDGFRENWRARTAGLARSTYLGEGSHLARTLIRTVDRIQSSAN